MLMTCTIYFVKWKIKMLIGLVNNTFRIWEIMHPSIFPTLLVVRSRRAAQRSIDANKYCLTNIVVD
jgi:hypothetical protein